MPTGVQESVILTGSLNYVNIHQKWEPLDHSDPNSMIYDSLVSMRDILLDLVSI